MSSISHITMCTAYMRGPPFLRAVVAGRNGDLPMVMGALCGAAAAQLEAAGHLGLPLMGPLTRGVVAGLAAVAAGGEDPVRLPVVTALTDAKVPVEHLQAHAAPDVFQVGHGLQMSGLTAEPLATQVVDLQAVRNLAV